MRRLIRYGLVGIVSNGTIYCVYVLATYLGMQPKAAMTLVYLIGATIGFVGNRTWTFLHEGSAAGAALRYVMAHAAGYMLNFMILSVFVDGLGYPHQWVQAAAIVVVAGFLFMAFNYFVFAEKRGAPRKT